MHKHVATTTVSGGFNRPTEITFTLKCKSLDISKLDSLELAVNEILEGRQIILSGTDIHFTGNLSVMVSDEAQALSAQVSELTEQLAKVTAERDRIQSCVDSFDKAMLGMGAECTRYKSI